MKCISQLELAQLVGTGVRPQFISGPRAHNSDHSFSDPLKLNLSSLDRKYFELCNMHSLYFHNSQPLGICDMQINWVKVKKKT